MILLDSNIVIDIIEKDAVWFARSFERVVELSKSEPILINHIVLAETAPFSGPLGQYLLSIETMGIQIEPICNQSAYAAGQAYLDYRKRRGPDDAKSILPDFLIGGHAQTLGATIFTRDPRFYRTYFPTVPLITPEETEE